MGGLRKKGKEKKKERVLCGYWFRHPQPYEIEMGKKGEKEKRFALSSPLSMEGAWVRKREGKIRTLFIISISCSCQKGSRRKKKGGEGKRHRAAIVI